MSYSGRKYGRGSSWLRVTPPFRFPALAGNGSHVSRFSSDALVLFYFSQPMQLEHP